MILIILAAVQMFCYLFSVGVFVAACFEQKKKMKNTDFIYLFFFWPVFFGFIVAQRYLV